jgi:hypothetical protein
MAKKRDDYRPCSDSDMRSAALRATHEKLHEMDDLGKPTIGKFGEVLSEQKAKFRIFGEHMAKKGTCSIMTWDELKRGADKFGKDVRKSTDAE